MDNAKLRAWLDRLGQYLSPTTIELPENIKQSILEPIRSGDPVFTTIASRELLQVPLVEACLDILLLIKPSPIRILLCEIIFCICKCPAAECRLFVASQIPALMWSSWILDSIIAIREGTDNHHQHEEEREGKMEKSKESTEKEDGKNDKIDNKKEVNNDEDSSAVEIATIAAFQQDIIVHPQLPCVKIPSLREKSIYHSSKDFPPSIIPSGTRERNPLFPLLFNSGLSLEFIPDILMQPIQNIGKIDENSRIFLYYRLSRIFNDTLSKMPNYSRLIFCLVIAHLTAKSSEQTRQIVSNLSLTTNKKEALLALFGNTPPIGNRIFQSNDNLFSVWNDSLIFINIPIIPMIQELLLERAKQDSLPMTLLQLLPY